MNAYAVTFTSLHLVRIVNAPTMSQAIIEFSIRYPSYSSDDITNIRLL